LRRVASRRPGPTWHRIPLVTHEIDALIARLDDGVQAPRSDCGARVAPAASKGRPSEPGTPL
jgi:hypothetical protein